MTPPLGHFYEDRAAPVAKLQPLRTAFRPFTGALAASGDSSSTAFSLTTRAARPRRVRPSTTAKKVFTPFTAKAREPIVARRLAALTCWPKFTAPHAAPQLIVRTHAGPKIVVPIAPLLCDPQKR